MISRITFLIFTCLLWFAGNTQNLQSETNRVVEWSYYSTNEYVNPFREVELVAEITSENGKVQLLPAFWAGGNKWSFRYSNPVTGTFRFKTICSNSNDHGLHDQKGAIEIVPYSGKNDLLKRGTIKVTDDNRHLEHLDGTPFFWLADSWWHGMTTRFKWPEDFAELTNDRKEKGFSVIQFAIAFPCDIEPFDPRGMNKAGNPWDENWNSIRPEYFDYTDRRVEHLVEEGLLPNIVGAWGYYIKFAGAENLKKHWQYLIARYGAYPVTYTLCGESTLAWYHDLGTNWEEQKKIFRKEWSEVAAHIQEVDPYDRLLTVHPGPNSGDFLPINEMQHIDFVMLQSGHDGYFTFQRASDAVDKAQEMYPEKPIMHGEVCFEGMGGKSLADVQRFLFWNNIMKGTAGFSYGVEGIWQFNTEEELFGVSPGGNVWGNVPWETAYQYDGSKHVGIGKKILENYEWWKLKPAQERVVNPATEAARTAWCAEIPGEVVMAYMFRKPTGWNNYQIGGFAPDQNYDAVFWDPLTGENYDDWSFETDENGIIHINDAPIKQDWLVVINL